MSPWFPLWVFYGAISALAICPFLVHAISLTSHTALPNGLELTFISDMQAKNAVIGLEVQVGGWQDPICHTGVSELIKQLLVTRIRKVACTRLAAFTESGRTCYLFSTTQESFFSTLKTLFDSCVQPFSSSQELQSTCADLQEEAALMRQTDASVLLRMLQLSADPQHPFAQDRFGDLEGLSKVPLETLSKWKSHYYRPEKMHLVVQAPLPPVELERGIKELIYEVNGFQRSAQEPLESELLARSVSEMDAFAQDKWQGRVSCMSPSSKPILMLAWEIVPDLSRALLPLANHLAGLLNEKGDGSLYADYAQKGWVTDVSNCVQALPNGALLFTSEWALSLKGLQHDTEIVQGVIEALKRWKTGGIPLYYIEERQKQLALQALDDEKTPFESVRALLDQSEEQLKNREDAASYSMSTWRTLCAQIGAETMHIVKSAPRGGFKLPLSETDPLSGISYMSAPFSKKQRQKWVNAHASLLERIPPLNPWMPKHIVSNTVDCFENIPSLDRVEQVMQSAHGTFHHLELDPKAYFGAWRMRWQFALCDLNPVDRLYRELLIKILRLSAVSREEAAKRAGISTECIEEKGAFCVDVFGYPERLLDYLNTWVDDLSADNVREELFVQAKEQLLADLQEENRKGNAGSLKLLDQVFERQLLDAEQRKVLKGLTVEQFKPHSARLLSPQSVDLIGVTPFSSHKSVEWWNALQKRIEPHIKCGSTKGVSGALLQEAPYALQLRVPREGHRLVWMVEAAETYSDVALDLLTIQLKEFLINRLLKEEKLVEAIDFERIDYQDSAFLVCSLASSRAKPEELLLRLERLIEHFVEQEKGTAENRALLQELQQVAKTPIAACRFISQAMAYKQRDLKWQQRKAQECAVLSYKRYDSQVVELLGADNKKRIAFLFQGRPVKEACTYRTVRSWKGLLKAYGDSLK